jgi:hypothetical protein
MAPPERSDRTDVDLCPKGKGSSEHAERACEACHKNTNT